MNYFLLNLSLADILSGISVYPYLFILDVGNVLHRPREQAILCMVTEGLGFFFIASGVSLLTLCGISYNRFFAVKYPLKTKLRMNYGTQAIAFSILAWIISTATMIPNMRSFQYERNLTSCIRD